MQANELREKYLAFFETKGCVRKPSDVRCTFSSCKLICRSGDSIVPILFFENTWRNGNH